MCFSGGGFLGMGGVKERTVEEQNAAEVAWANRPEQLQINAIAEEKKRQAQEASDRMASKDLSDALTRQKSFAAKAQGKSGTLLTGALGVTGVATGEQVAGQKTLLGT